MKDLVKFLETLAGKLSAILAFAILAIFFLLWMGNNIPLGVLILIYIIVIGAMVIFFGQFVMRKNPEAASTLPQTQVSSPSEQKPEGDSAQEVPSTTAISSESSRKFRTEATKIQSLDNQVNKSTVTDQGSDRSRGYMVDEGSEIAKSRVSNEENDDMGPFLRELNNARIELTNFTKGYILLIEPWVDCGIAKSKLDEESGISNDQYWKDIKTLLKDAHVKISGDVPSSLKSMHEFSEFKQELDLALQLIESLSVKMAKSKRVEVFKQASNHTENAVLMVEKIVKECQERAHNNIGKIEGLISSIPRPYQASNNQIVHQSQKSSSPAVVRSRNSPKQSDNLPSSANSQATTRRRVAS